MPLGGAQLHAEDRTAGRWIVIEVGDVREGDAGDRTSMSAVERSPTRQARLAGRQRDVGVAAMSVGMSKATRARWPPAPSSILSARWSGVRCRPGNCRIVQGGPGNRPDRGRG